MTVTRAELSTRDRRTGKSPIVSSGKSTVASDTARKQLASFNGRTADCRSANRGSIPLASATRAKAEIGEAMRLISNSIVHPDQNALRYARLRLEQVVSFLDGR
jgi:hypothetical protein